MCSSVCVYTLFVFFNEQISPCNTRGCCKCLCVQVLVQRVYVQYQLFLSERYKYEYLTRGRKIRFKVIGGDDVCFW